MPLSQLRKESKTNEAMPNGHDDRLNAALAATERIIEGVTGYVDGEGNCLNAALAATERIK